MLSASVKTFRTVGKIFTWTCWLGSGSVAVYQTASNLTGCFPGSELELSIERLKFAWVASTSLAVHCFKIPVCFNEQKERYLHH